MSKRIIAAISQNPSDPVYYFAGYHDQGETSECRWTLSRDHARWFDADEAEVEALLLTPDYVDCSYRDAGCWPAYLTRAATRAPRRALPRRRALCTNAKKPR